MDSKPWYQSKTIWAAVVAAISAGLSLLGHTIEPDVQEKLVGELSAIADFIATVSGIIAIIGRAKANTILTKGETK